MHARDTARRTLGRVTTRRPAWLQRAAAVLTVALGTLLAYPPFPASAHPLGNFSVNQYRGLVFTPEELRVVAAVNTAELPTAAERPTVDENSDGTITDTERARYAATACAQVGDQFDVRVDGQRLAWQVTPGQYEYRPGAAGLPSAILTCSLRATTRIEATTNFTVANRLHAERVGWQEMTARGQGVHLLDSPLPERSATDELRSYPEVASPEAVRNVRAVTLRVAPGAAGPGGVAARVPEASDPVTSSMVRAEGAFMRVAAGPMTPLLVVLALLLALLLGAGHAILPGHGKTVLAAYMAGRDGRIRDAFAVGATVTATHTGAVLVVGVLISTGTALAGERLLGYLGVVSGLLILSVGATMVVSRRRALGHSHEHSHGHEHHDHRHGVNGPGHEHDHAEGHNHHGSRGARRLGLAGMGIAGGLVPSPSALVVLLAAVGLGRAAFGVVLVIAYGLGMAATLTVAGLLLLGLQRRISNAHGRLARLATAAPRAAPMITACLVIVVGLGLTARATLGLL